MMSLLLALALQGTLDARAREFHCDDPQNQMEMNMCAGLDFERADAELNAAWRVALAGARAADAELDRRYDRRPTTEAKLREAQRAWLVFRDAHCTVQGYDEARGPAAAIDHRLHAAGPRSPASAPPSSADWKSNNRDARKDPDREPRENRLPRGRGVAAGRSRAARRQPAFRHCLHGNRPILRQYAGRARHAAL